ncbi:MAG: hypothetical protein H6812_02455 [Phycisphaeraceae bacterium]|nr:hypothetical protein [Phycisphaeraceae bacterium]
MRLRDWSSACETRMVASLIRSARMDEPAPMMPPKSGTNSARGARKKRAASCWSAGARSSRSLTMTRPVSET